MTTMDINLIRSVITVAALAAFIGIVWWAYGSSRRARFELDAQLPFSGTEEEEGARR